MNPRLNSYAARQMLEACGMAALAAEARRALRQMCGAPSDSEDEQLGEEEG